MKLLFSLLSIILLTKECESTKNSSTASNLSESNQTKLVVERTVQEDSLVINYTAQTRGTYQNISVSKERLSITNSRDKQSTKYYNCSKEDWDDILFLISNIDVSKLNSLKAPSTKSHTDAALAATLKLTIDGKEISTPNFDHGQPPKQIEALVNKVLSMKEDAIKE